jgi:hypothetical protein
VRGLERGVIDNSGHWIMEEQTQQAVTMITRFIKEQ